MFKKQIISTSGKLVYSNLPETFFACPSICNSNNEITVDCPTYNKKRRRGKSVNGLSSVYLCFGDNDHINSSLLFKGKMETYGEIINEIETLKFEIKEDLNQEVKRLIHNLTSLNAHSIQELYNLVPQELLTKNFKNQINIIKELIIQEPDEAAATFLRIAKHNASMKTKFAAFNKLYETNPTLQFRQHTIRKVVFNLLYIFFQDFTDLDIYVDVKENYDVINFDYESMHVALYHIFENATKYAKPNETIYIDFLKSNNCFEVKIEMTSIQITNEDAIKLFEDKYSGINAKKLNKAGSGIGLNIVQRILKLNNAELIIQRNTKQNYNTVINSIPYERNIFKIQFDKTRK